MNMIWSGYKYQIVCCIEIYNLIPILSIFEFLVVKTILTILSYVNLHLEVTKGHI